MKFETPKSKPKREFLFLENAAYRIDEILAMYPCKEGQYDWEPFHIWFKTLRVKEFPEADFKALLSQLKEIEQLPPHVQD